MHKQHTRTSLFAQPVDSIHAAGQKLPIAFDEQYYPIYGTREIAEKRLWLEYQRQGRRPLLWQAPSWECGGGGANSYLTAMTLPTRPDMDCGTAFTGMTE